MTLIPGRGTKIPQATWHGQKKKTRKKRKGTRKPSYSYLLQPGKPSNIQVTRLASEKG